MKINQFWNLKETHIRSWSIPEGINHRHLMTHGGQDFQIGLQVYVLGWTRKWKSGQDPSTIRF